MLILLSLSLAFNFFAFSVILANYFSFSAICILKLFCRLPSSLSTFKALWESLVKVSLRFRDPDLPPLIDRICSVEVRLSLDLDRERDFEAELLRLFTTGVTRPCGTGCILKETRVGYSATNLGSDRLVFRI